MNLELFQFMSHGSACYRSMWSYSSPTISLIDANYFFNELIAGLHQRFYNTYAKRDWL